MSILTNKMKAVPVLLKQLMTTRRKFHERGRDESLDKKLEKLRLDLNRIKDVFVRVKKNEEELLDTLAEVYGHLRRLDRGKLDEDMDGICKRIRDCSRKLLPKDGFDESYKEEDEKGVKISHSSQELVQPHLNKSWTLEDYYRLSLPSRFCLLSLQIFPENAVIRKRNAINFWIGEGLIRNTENKTAEEMGEDVIQDLWRCNVIVRYGNEKSPLVKKFQILSGDQRHLEPNLDGDFDYIRPSPLQLDSKKVTVGGVHRKNVTLRNIFNIGASYLNFSPQWTTELRNLEVLQLGRWQDSALHHIEVGSQEFLKDLRYLKELKYLSLRGISRIFEVPSSIAELEKLLILDVKACHNLERLPDDISSMKSLTHLIMSDCCLLEGMPKGIEKLSNLEVLKGFLISTPEKTPCRISDLKNLEKLRRLSIRIGSEAQIRDEEFEGLKDFLALENLKISWSVSNPKYAKIKVVLPLRLKKLHLECFPGKSLQEYFIFIPSVWFDSIPTELNITGGKLERMVDFQWWRVDILRLKYLKQLNVDIHYLKAKFPLLKYVEIKQISNHSYIEHEWRI
ncbi:disease resistance protein RPS2 [Vigna unguiculata]|uniref:Disease resistance protein RPS2 n=1 Tax=Vigna unguiculata TaxID=3917 RepID=A0A4D6NI91_VIGUN|nr:disease resistance protein RPS2 [Vigna unguiculata]